jgi:putative ABC transport system permease protein
VAIAARPGADGRLRRGDRRGPGIGDHLVNASALEELHRALAVVDGDAQAQLVAGTGRMDESAYPAIAADPGAGGQPGHRCRGPGRDRPDAAGGRPVADCGYWASNPFAAARSRRRCCPRPGSPGTTASRRPPRCSPTTVCSSRAAMRRFAVEPGQTIRLRIGLSSIALRVLGEVPGATAEQVLGVMDIGAMQWRLGWLGHLSRIDLRLHPRTDLRALDQAWQARRRRRLASVDARSREPAHVEPVARLSGQSQRAVAGGAVHRRLHRLLDPVAGPGPAALDARDPGRAGRAAGFRPST